MSHDLVLDILERVRQAARLVLDERDEPGVLVDDLRGLIGALDLMLRRYREATAQTSASGAAEQRLDGHR